jgi:hypothetical protein
MSPELMYMAFMHVHRMRIESPAAEHRRTLRRPRPTGRWFQAGHRWARRPKPAPVGDATA